MSISFDCLVGARNMGFTFGSAGIISFAFVADVTLIGLYWCLLHSLHRQMPEQS